VQLYSLDESEVFYTQEINTLYINSTKAKSISDADSEFIATKLQKDFKKWGELVKFELDKNGYKLREYISQLI
jgi:hypothetical protein